MNEKIDILLIEDNPADVELTLHGFRTQNITDRIHVASDGAEALQIIFGLNYQNPRDLASGPKLVLLDLKLPKVDGLEVLRRIKENPDTRQIPVVILTSSKEMKDMVKAYHFGANSYITKPVDFQEFKKVAKKLYTYWVVTNQLPM